MFAVETLEKPRAPSPLESWSSNERMRHISPIEVMRQRLDGTMRKRIETLLASCGSARDLPESVRIQMELELRELCRAIDRVCETARSSRPAGHAPSEISARIGHALQNAVASLNAVDGELYGRRYPFQTLERSRAEPLSGSMLVLGEHIRRLTRLIRTIDPDIDEKLLAGLVVQASPVDDQTRNPIA
jgi:hypothetical protein